MTRAELLLVQLGEEASEITKEAAKCLRFTPEEIYAPIGISNAARVVAEIHDLMTIVEMLHEEGVLPRSTVAEKGVARQAKRIKVEAHLDYSRKCGVLV